MNTLYVCTYYVSTDGENSHPSQKDAKGGGSLVGLGSFDSAILRPRPSSNLGSVRESVPLLHSL